MDDIFLLFLPNFLLNTALHHLVGLHKYDLFNRVTETVKKFFEEFLNTEDYINRIIEMFIYILENVSAYPRSALEEIYCDLPFYESDESSDFDENDTPSYKILKSNVLTIQTFLTTIRSKVEGTKRFSDRVDFNFVPDKII